MKPSIRAQLLCWLLVPLFVLSTIITVFAYSRIVEMVQQAGDRELLNSADSVIARMHTVNGKKQVDLPDWVVNVLQHFNEAEEFDYQVLNPKGEVEAADSKMPLPDSLAELQSAVFETKIIRGRPMRVATMTVRGMHGDPKQYDPDNYHIVQVAETFITRHELVQKIMFVFVAAEALLLLFGGLCVWFGVTLGMRPLSDLQTSIGERSQFDLSAIDQGTAPVEVRPMVQALNDLLGRLRVEMETQRRFAANAAHQLRTPLAGLKTYADLASKVSRDKETSDVIGELQTGVTRMANLVNRLLSLAKWENAAADPKVAENIDLNEVASNVTAELVPESIEKNIDLGFEGASKPALVVGDPTSLKELATNLVENAVRYTPRGGKVTVSVNATEPVSLEVLDNGPGIPPDERQKVFERFYRVLGTNVDGSGLGLSIVHEIARAHKAKVLIEDGENKKGTRIRVIFAH